MTKQQTLELVGKVLSNNIDNRLTAELANGIIFVIAQNYPDEPKPAETEGAE